MITPSTSSSKPNPLIEAFCQRLYAAQITEYQFQQEASFIRAFRDATPDLLLQLSAEGIVLNINRSPEFKLFHDTADILQRNIAELLPPVQAHTLRAALEYTLREQKATRCEWTLPIEEKEHHLEVRVTYLRFDRVLVIVRDVTAQQQALDQLREFPRQLLNAQEQERSRLSRDLHDEIGQDLTAIILAVTRAQPGATSSAQRDLVEAETMLQALARKVRRLAQDLYPATLNDLGLTTALTDLLGRFVLQTSLHVEWRLPDAAQRFPPEVEMAAYRVVQEALTNVARHAAAQSVMVNVNVKADQLHIQVVDDGQGFELSTIHPAESQGLSSMRERAKLLGGNFGLETTPGSGTRLWVELPLAESHAGEEST